MKKLTYILGLSVALLCAGSVSAQASKVGHVDFQSVVDAMPETAEAMKSLQDYEAELMGVLQEKQMEYQTKLNRLQTDTTLSLTVQQDLYDALVALEESIVTFEQNAQQELIIKENNLIAPIVDKVDAAIATVAEAGGFTYIINAGVLHYVNGPDITADVKAQLGIQ